MRLFTPALVLSLPFALAVAAEPAAGFPPPVEPGQKMSPTGLPAVLSQEDIAKLTDPAATPTDSLFKKAAELHRAGRWEEAGSWAVVGRWTEFVRAESAKLPPGLPKVFWERPDWMTAFVANLSPADKTSEVARILGDICKAEPQQVAPYLNLALAIAMVYDQRPPGNWPHGQVSGSALSRSLKDPVEVFRFFVNAHAKGRLLENPAKMEVRELVYVVDLAAGLEELSVAQQKYSARARLPGLYGSIRYDHPRADKGVYSWPFPSYTLEDISKEGGICVDQAYYMSQICKGLGVPAVIFSGGGQDGYHAWVAYQEKAGKWNMGVGRYAEHKYAIGHGHDPQTWKQTSDWDLAFLSERFFEAPRYRESFAHALLGDVFETKLKDKKSAAGAFRASVEAERRNASSWDKLIRVYRDVKATPEHLEPILETAATSLSRYADLEADYRSQLADSMEKRGDAEGAEKMRQRLMRRYVEVRPDLALEQASKRLKQVITEGDLIKVRKVYNSLMLYFDDAGTAAWENLTLPYVRVLENKKENKAALDAVRTARRKLKPGSDSQLDKYMADLEKRLEKA